jgi:hypothetical protein
MRLGENALVVGGLILAITLLTLTAGVGIADHPMNATSSEYDDVNNATCGVGINVSIADDHAARTAGYSTNITNQTVDPNTINNTNGSENFTISTSYDDDKYFNARRLGGSDEFSEKDHYGPYFKCPGYFVAIDTSGSMNQSSNGRKKMKIAKDNAKSYIHGLSNESKVAVGEYDDGSSILTGLQKLNKNYSDFESSISGLKNNSSGSTDLIAAIDMGRGQLSGIKNSETQTTVFSDGKHNQDDTDASDVKNESKCYREDGYALGLNSIGSGADTDAYENGTCGGSLMLNTQTQPASVSIHSSSAKQPKLRSHGSAFPDDVFASTQDLLKWAAERDRVSDTGTQSTQARTVTGSFTVGNDTSDGNVAIWAPNGSVELYTPDGALAQNKTTVNRLTLPTITSYSIEEAPAGRWEYHIRRDTSSELQYRVIANFDTPLEFDAGTGRQKPAKNTNTELLAALSDTRQSSTETNGTVTAEITRPDGSTESVTLQREGDYYSTDLPVSMAGPYDVALDAESNQTQLEHSFDWRANGWDETPPPLKNFEVIQDSDHNQLLAGFDSRERLAERELVLYGRDNQSERWQELGVRNGRQLKPVGDTYLDRFQTPKTNQSVVVLEDAMDPAGNDAADGQYKTLNASPETAAFELSGSTDDNRFNITLSTSRSDVKNYTVKLEYDTSILYADHVDAKPTMDESNTLAAQSTQGDTAVTASQGPGDTRIVWRDDGLVIHDVASSDELAEISFKVVDRHPPEWTSLEVDRTHSDLVTDDGTRPLVTDHDHKKIVPEPYEEEEDDGDDGGAGGGTGGGGAGGGGGGGGGGAAGGAPVSTPEQFARSNAIQIEDAAPQTPGTQLPVEKRGLKRISFSDDIEGGFYFLDADRRSSLPRGSRALRTVDLDIPPNAALTSATLTFTLPGDTNLSRYEQITVYRRGSVEPAALPTNVTRRNGTVTVTAETEIFSDWWTRFVVAGQVESAPAATATPPPTPNPELAESASTPPAAQEEPGTTTPEPRSTEHSDTPAGGTAATPATNTEPAATTETAAPGGFDALTVVIALLAGLVVIGTRRRRQ